MAVTSRVSLACDPVSMLDWKDVTDYGFSGLLVVAVVYLATKLIGRGFSLRVPPRER